MCLHLYVSMRIIAKNLQRMPTKLQFLSQIFELSKIIEQLGLSFMTRAFNVRVTLTYGLNMVLAARTRNFRRSDVCNQQLMQNNFICSHAYLCSIKINCQTVCGTVGRNTPHTHIDRRLCGSTTLSALMRSLSLA